MKADAGPDHRTFRQPDFVRTCLEALRLDGGCPGPRVGEFRQCGPTFTVRFGKIGTSGQSQSKSFADAAKARSEMEKLIAEKVKKGYAERAE